MHDVKIKICGLTTLEDARFAAAAGADYLGFVQHRESPRFVPPDEAKQIIEWVYGPRSVGVFVNTAAADVNRQAEAAGFDFVQLHGAESPADCRQIERPVIKALHVGPDSTPETLRAAVDRYAEVVHAVLLDTKDARWGGTGTAFDWALAADLAAGTRLFLAGGLDPDNVAEAIRTVGPYAVDVSSGVEAGPGRKDFDKLTAFIDAVRQTTP